MYKNLQNIVLSLKTKGAIGLDKNLVLKKLPKVDEVLNSTQIQELTEKYNKSMLTNAVRESIEDVRLMLLKLLEKGNFVFEKDEDDLKKHVISLSITKLSKSPYSLKKVINATGVVLHTNLGRAPLPKKAIDRILDTASGYCNLEYDLEKGARGERYSHVNKLVADITGAQDALVVNNNAGAVFLCLSALAQDKEVVISRGQLVEIGGSFRIPDVMAQSGAHLVEVGTTNRTHIEDYEKAINENTALLLKVHTSNFQIRGFTSEVGKQELKTLARMHNIPVMEDLGSGVLVDLGHYGISEEPTVMDSVKADIDIITFSGDKLLGGPQAGIIIGKQKYVSKIKKHPLTRALRIDKLTLAALEQVLMFYRDDMLEEIPILQMLSRPIDVMERQAQEVAEKLKKVIGENGSVSIVDDESQVGGGSLPGEEFPTKAVAINIKGLSPDELSKRLRASRIPVIGRIKNERYLLDMRTISTSAINDIVEMVGDVL